MPSGDRLLLMVRPEHLQVSTSKPGDVGNFWPARVESVTFLGNFTECTVTLQGLEFTAQIAGMAFLSAGQDVFLRLPPDKCTIVRDEPVAVAAAPVAA